MFTSFRDGNGELYVIAPSGADTSLKRLTNTPFTDGGAAR
jgi:hypothetical protein